MRIVLLLVSIAWAMEPVSAQPAQDVGGEVRLHPAGADAVLAARPEGDLLIYRAGHSIRFERDRERASVSLAGDLLGFAASASASHTALLTRPPGSDSLLLSAVTGDGARQFEVAVPHHWDDPLPAFDIAGTGEVVYARPERAEVFFLEPGGALLRQVSLFDDAPHALERNVRVAFSPDGRFVAVAAQRSPAYEAASGAEPGLHLYLFGRDGTLHWTRPLSEPGLQALAFATDSLIAVSSYDAYATGGIRQQSRLFALDGNPVFETPAGAESFQVDAEGVLLVGKRSVAAFALPGGRLRFSYRSPSGDQIVSASASASAPQLALLVGRAAYAGQGFTFEDLRLLHVNAEGAVSGDRALGAATAHAPVVKLVPASRSTAVVLDDATHFFSW